MPDFVLITSPFPHRFSHSFFFLASLYDNDFREWCHILSWWLLYWKVQFLYHPLAILTMFFCHNIWSNLFVEVPRILFSLMLHFSSFFRFLKYFILSCLLRLITFIRILFIFSFIVPWNVFIMSGCFSKNLWIFFVTVKMRKLKFLKNIENYEEKIKAHYFRKQVRPNDVWTCVACSYFIDKNW